MANAGRDENRVAKLIVEDSLGNKSVVPLVADPITGRLLVNATITESSSSLDYPDTTYTWTGGNLTQKVEVYSDRTETTEYTWVGGLLTNKVTTIT
jgi:hypothetical protein